MDADLQDPPEAIPDLLARGRHGLDTVFAGRRGHYESTGRLMMSHLFKHLLNSGYIEQIEKVHREYLGIFSRSILAKIRNRDQSWEQMVPPQVAAAIKKGNFFGYRS